MASLIQKDVQYYPCYIFSKAYLKVTHPEVIYFIMQQDKFLFLIMALASMTAAAPQESLISSSDRLQPQKRQLASFLLDKFLILSLFRGLHYSIVGIYWMDGAWT
jgi:hypothetical protein